MTQIGRYESGLYNEDAAEIPTYDASTERAFVVDANQTSVDVLDISDPSNPTLVDSIRITDVWQNPGPANSAAARDGVVAVAVAADPETQPGRIFFYDTKSLDLLNSVTVGFLPDMVTFTPDGESLLVACEGEPNDSYDIDPPGSVTIIDVSRGVQNVDVATAGFEKFDSEKEALRKKGVLIYGPDATVAQDLEPEYIAVSADSKTAYVILQENNAIAVVDIAEASVRDIVPLGSKNFSLPRNALDAIDDKRIDIRTQPLYGVYQPDSIDAYTVEGETYLVTANEGDPRGYGGFTEFGILIEECGTFGLDTDDDGRIDVPIDESRFDRSTLSSLVGLRVSTFLGDVNDDGILEELYIYGGRSFAIWKPTDAGISLDSNTVDNLIYNNLLNNTQNVDFAAGFDNGSNTWNVTNQSGPNIIGGPNLGGNYYATPTGDGFSQTCTDANDDGFCDTPNDFGVANNNTDFLPLAGEPNISVSPASVGFGTVTVGDNATANVTVTNTGTGTLDVTDTTISGPNAGQFSIASGGAPFSLVPSESQNATVQFTPTSTGTKNATLQIDSTDSNDPTVSVPLSGTGVQGIPVSNSTEITEPGVYELTQNITDCPNDTCIDIQSSNVVFDGNNHTISGLNAANTIGVGATGGLSNVTVRNVTVTEWETGITFDRVTEGTIANVTALNNDRSGVALRRSNTLQVRDVISRQNGYHGLDLEATDDSTLTAIRAAENQRRGIGLVSSDSNQLTRATVEDNQWAGIRLSRSDSNQLGRVTAETNDLGINLVRSNTTTLTDSMLATNDATGLSLDRNIATTVRNTTVQQNGQAGAVLKNSPQTRLLALRSAQNVGDGLRLTNSDTSTVRNGTIEQNGGQGLNLVNVDDSTINNVTVLANAIDGIRLQNANTVLITRATVRSNLGNGIELRDSRFNSVTRNTVCLNEGQQIVESGTSGDNTIVNNDFCAVSAASGPTTETNATQTTTGC